MTDNITAQDRRLALRWCGMLGDSTHHEEAAATRRIILATVEAPAPSLAEELARIAESSPVWTIQNVCDELKSAAARAEKIDQERDEARDKVERLTTERDYLDNGLAAVIDRCNAEEKAKREAIQQRDEARAEVERLDAVSEDYARRATAALTERDEARDEVERLTAVNEELRRTDNYREFKAFLGVQKDAEINAETPDPADVKPGEAWIVECRGERRNALKDNTFDIQWDTVNADGWSIVEDNEDITLVSRLVPAPRVITNPDELEALPHRTVIRDNAGVMFQRIVHGWYQAGDTSVHRSDDNFVCLPATVLWEPEA